MSPTDLAGLLLGVAGLIAVGALMAGAPAAFEALFRSPIELGWPKGIQEDDELRWSWRSAGSHAEQAETEAGSDATFEVPAAPIRPRISRR